ncbi:MAG: hypothetical protein ACFFG0_49510, partial [Candidatus Thorarchaeota archaeon]
MKTFLLLTSSCLLLVFLLLLLSGEISKTPYLFKFLFSHKKYVESFKPYYEAELAKYKTEQELNPDNQIRSAMKIKHRMRWA